MRVHVFKHTHTFAHTRIHTHTNVFPMHPQQPHIHMYAHNHARQVCLIIFMPQKVGKHKYPCVCTCSNTHIYSLMHAYIPTQMFSPCIHSNLIFTCMHIIMHGKCASSYLCHKKWGNTNTHACARVQTHTYIRSCTHTYPHKCFPHASTATSYSHVC